MRAIIIEVIPKVRLSMLFGRVLMILKPGMSV
jgi:hypothetical protein